jgi:hypothetical protein
MEYIKRIRQVEDPVRVQINDAQESGLPIGEPFCSFLILVSRVRRTYVDQCETVTGLDVGWRAEDGDDGLGIRFIVLHEKSVRRLRFAKGLDDKDSVGDGTSLEWKFMEPEIDHVRVIFVVSVYTLYSFPRKFVLIVK